MYISDTIWKIGKSFFVFEITVFEGFAENSAYCDENTCTRQSMCKETVLRFQIWLRQNFSNSIYPRFMEKFGNSCAVLIWAVFRTR